MIEKAKSTAKYLKENGYPEFTVEDFEEAVSCKLITFAGFYKTFAFFPQTNWLHFLNFEN